MLCKWKFCYNKILILYYLTLLGLFLCVSFFCLYCVCSKVPFINSGCWSPMHLSMCGFMFKYALILLNWRGTTIASQPKLTNVVAGQGPGYIHNCYRAFESLVVNHQCLLECIKCETCTPITVSAPNCHLAFVHITDGFESWRAQFFAFHTFALFVFQHLFLIQLLFHHLPLPFMVDLQIFWFFLLFIGSLKM